MKKVITLILLSWAYLINLSAQQELFVSPNGDDSNPGTKELPLKTLIGARDKAREVKSGGLPPGGLVVNFREGRYPVTQTCKLTQEDSGESASPIVYKGYQDEKVIFDGSVFVDNTAFQKTTSNQSSILHKNAVGKVYYQLIKDANLINVLKESSAQMSMNDRMMIVARFPNIGYAHVKNETFVSGSETVKAEGTYSQPQGAKFQMYESMDFDKLDAEIKRTQSVQANGYISAHWHKEHNFVASASGGNIQFKDGSSYGLQPLIEKNSPIRFFVSHALCELDEAGEWFFDPTNNTLYLWPTEEITPDSKIGVWAGPEMVRVENAQNIQFKNMIIQCLGKGKNGDGAINFRSGDNFLVAGVTFRNIGEPLLACNFWDDVTNSKMLSCDFFDNWNNTRLYGGSFTSKGEIKQGNNRIENCHFTQIYSKDYYGKASGISGVGNVFKNNLIHNTNGQPVTYAGLDHTLYLNEVFNVAVEEGDGGAFYTGNDVVSYGNLLKHNFMHHIMSVPQLIGRASFHCDDMDSGDKIEENVFYKGGWKTVKFGRGAGHTVQKNVFVKSYQGIATGQAGEAKYLKCMDYLNSVDGKKPTDGIKENYLGRMLQKVGVDGWETQVNSSNWYNLIEPFWKERYPYFNTVMKKYFDNSTMDAWECRFYNNYFNNSLNKDIETEVSTAPSIKGSVQIADNVFSDLSTLNLQFNGNQPADAPVIPFDNIGLYLDEYRCAIPNKNEYRQAIKNHFENQECHNSDAYDYSTINQRIYYNTGKIVMATAPCAGAYVQTDFWFDLGTTSSTVFDGYERLSNQTTPGIYGWTDTNGLNAIDRGTSGGANYLNRDLIYSSQAKTFVVAVPNGKYKVLITFGDASSNHDKMVVKAEGQTKLTDINSIAGVFFNETFEVDVNDEELTLEFSDAGGADPNWVATRVIINLLELGTVPQAPIVSFASLQSGIELPYQSDLSVTVNATDADGTIANVKLYLNSQLVRQENVAPYEWGMNNQNDPLLKGLQAGSYTLLAVAEDNSGLTSSATIVVKVQEDLSTSIIDNSGMDGLIVYPNPFNSFITISSIEYFVRAFISDITGKTFMSQELSGSEIQLSTSDLPSGMYILRIQTETREWVIKKMIKL